jgi:hypothetical protein
MYMQEASRDLYERHADFQCQLRFVKNHEPQTADDDDFCTQGGIMELHTIIEYVCAISFYPRSFY